MRPIASCLNKQLTELCQRSVQLEELSNQVTQLLPIELASECKVANFSKGCLLLTTTQATWASQLRYALPELRDKLREGGMHQLTSIKVIVAQPPDQYKKPVRQRTLELSEKAKATIVSESQQCTYQPLQKALLHLARKATV